MKIYDSHTHLNADPLFQDWQSYLQNFIDVEGAGLVNSGASEQYNLRGIEIAKTIEILKDGKMERWGDVVVKSTIGYHPDCCSNGEITEENIQQKISELRKLYEENKEYIVAIGECGIDTYFPGSEDFLPLQKKLFALQCDLAQELKVPLMIHTRKDFTSAFEILQNYRDMTVYVHCWGFGQQEIEMLKRGSVELGWRLFIGFCGNVTYKNAHNLRDSLQHVPLDRLLLETDAPWLSPQAVRGTTNHPAHVKYIYEYVALLLHIDAEKLAQLVADNFHVLYKI